MVTCIVSLVIFMAMLGCGILVNMYLYTRGMFQGSVSHRSEDWDEEYFSVHMSGRYDVTGSYVRKGLFLTVAAIVLACVVMMTILVPSWH
jgi:hypothetical protein